MRIKIGEFEKFGETLRKADAAIISHRTSHDAEYEHRWLKGHSGFLFWKKPREGKPPVNQEACCYEDWYPCRSGMFERRTIKTALKAMNTPGVVEIALDDDEFTSVMSWVELCE